MLSATRLRGSVGRKMTKFQLLFQSRKQVLVRRGHIRRIGWMIKTLEALVGQFLLGCKCPVSWGIVVQEQDHLCDLPGDFPSKCPSIAPAEMSNTPRWYFGPLGDNQCGECRRKCTIPGSRRQAYETTVYYKLLRVGCLELRDAIPPYCWLGVLAAKRHYVKQNATCNFRLYRMEQALWTAQIASSKIVGSSLKSSWNSG
jgi:hypothetical protein